MIRTEPQFRFCPRCGARLQSRHVGAQERTACSAGGCGFVHWNNPVEAGILPEVKEELGLIGEITSLLGVYPFPQMNQVIIAWHVQATGTIQLGEELRACKRIGRQQLRPWGFGTGLAVRDWLQQQGRTLS